MTVLGSLVRGRDEARAIQATAWGDWGDGTSSTWSGANVTASTSLQLLTVYGCNQFICNGISTLPVDTFRRGPVKAPVPNPMIIEEPAPGLDYIAWATQFLTSHLLGGDFFGWRIVRGIETTGVIPLDPTKVDVFRRGGRRWFKVEGQEFDSFQILHIPAIMWPGAERGMSPIEAARQSIGVGMAAQEYAARSFGDDPTPPGVIEVPTEMQPDQIREMARAWSRAHSGKSNRKLPGVLQGGAQWKSTTVTNEQAQFLESRKFTASEIAAQLFLIDPPEMGLPVEGTSITYSNQEQRNTRKVQVTFLPWIVRLEKALSVMAGPDNYVKVNVNGLLRGDTKTRFEGYKIGVDEEILTRDEIRSLEELPPLPEKSPAPPALVDQIDAVGQLIRAGFDPQASLAFLGLPPITHTGLVPITVTEEGGGKSPGGINA